MIDEIGGSNMIQGSLTTFTTDRFGNINSALALNGGWTRVPAGVHFNTPQFTISSWIYTQNLGSQARLIDFGNGANMNNVVVTFNKVSTMAGVEICPGSPCIVNFASSVAFTLNTWQFLAVTFDGATFSIYIDAVLTGSLSYTYTMPALTRTNNYIGRSNWAIDSYSWSYVDDLRFFNMSLSQTDIYFLMNLTSKWENFVFNSYLFPITLFREGKNYRLID